MIKSKKITNKYNVSKKGIYLDYASATPVDKRVISIINQNLKRNFANPSAIHELGLKVNKILEDSRAYISNVLGSCSDEIIFTGGATENNNLAIRGVLEKNTFFIPHIITSNIEHPSVMEICKYLEETKKAEVTYVNVESNGLVDPKKIKKAFRLNTIMVSVMYANNEIGTIQPIKEIAKEVRHFRKKNNSIFPIFYTDATQAVNYLPIKVANLGVDMLSFNGDKIYGPKDIGVLYVKRGIPIGKIMFGGAQEFGIRPGTENLASIVGIREALKITERIKEKESERLTLLRDFFIKKILELDNTIKINGDLKNRLPNNINISIPKIPSDLILIELSARGIYVSEKSACKSGEKKSSYVINALYKNDYGSLRFSLGRDTKKEDIDYVIKSLKDIFKKLKKWYD